MCSNLVSGMLQRIDKLRKYAFASVLVLGEDNKAAIEGVWVMRGQELAFNVRMDVLYAYTVMLLRDVHMHKILDLILVRI